MPGSGGVIETEIESESESETVIVIVIVIVIVGRGAGGVAAVRGAPGVLEPVRGTIEFESDMSTRQPAPRRPG